MSRKPGKLPVDDIADLANDSLVDTVDALGDRSKAIPGQAAAERSPVYHADQAGEVGKEASYYALEQAKRELAEFTAKDSRTQAELAELRLKIKQMEALGAVDSADAQFLMLDPEAIDDTLPCDRVAIAFEDVDFQNLRNSLEAEGQIEPIVVRPLANQDGRVQRYDIITGRRRLRALTQLGQKVLARVIEADDAKALGMMYAENEERADIGALERGRWFKGYMHRLRTNKSEIARRFKLSHVIVGYYIAITEIPDEIISRIRDPRRISVNKGRRLLDLLKKEGAYERVIAALDARSPDSDASRDIDIAIEAADGRTYEPETQKIMHKGRKIGSLSMITGRWNIRFTDEVDETIAKRLISDIPGLIEQYKQPS